MTEIPKEALERAAELANIAAKKDGRFGGYTAGNAAGFGGTAALARYIADVSEKADYADRFLEPYGLQKDHPTRERLRSLILPNPEANLLKEAEEIVKQHRWSPDESAADYAARCTLAALRKGN